MVMCDNYVRHSDNTHVMTCHSDTLYLDPQPVLVDVCRHGSDPGESEVKHRDRIAKLLNPTYKHTTTTGQQVSNDKVRKMRVNT